MAIIPQYPGLETSIISKGAPLAEYPAPIHSENSEALPDLAVVSKYIESVTNQEFTLSVAIKGPFVMTSTAVLVEVWVDGRRLHGTILTRNRFLKKGGQIGKLIKGIDISVGNQRKVRVFKFAKIETSKHFHYSSFPFTFPSPSRSKARTDHS